MRIRTCKDNRQLEKGERQIEDLQGAISVLPASPMKGVMVITVRGIPSRQAQYAILSREGVDALIEDLKRVRDSEWGQED